jgi:hypothetical protein
MRILARFITVLLDDYYAVTQETRPAVEAHGLLWHRAKSVMLQDRIALAKLVL